MHIDGSKHQEVNPFGDLQQEEERVDGRAAAASFGEGGGRESKLTNGNMELARNCHIFL